MINRVVLTGRLTKDIELIYTQSNVTFGHFTLAVNRQFKNADGEREADFINCVIWRKVAENLAKFTHKGSLIGIEGRLQTRSYENQQGQRVYVTEVVVDGFSLLNTKQDNQDTQSQQLQHDSESAQSRQNQPVQQSDPFADNQQKLDITDDDLPF